MYSKIIRIAYNDIDYINDVTIGIDYTSCAVAQLHNRLYAMAIVKVIAHDV